MALENEAHRLLSEIDPKAGLKNFRKRRYEEFFLNYRSSMRDVYELFTTAYRESANDEEKEEKMNAAALDLVSWAKNAYESTGRFGREQKLIDMQCMLVFYVFPGILSNSNEEDRMLTDIIIAQWKAAFPKSNISAAGFDEINGGFKDTIFGLDIADMFKKKLSGK
ncbi:MAG: hypothetical protein K5894_01550 [Lachnospiraceae bacterium]|nr:hypothetical protein [Lachnospiraceae bacterium]MDN4742396.1 hypothetical protein [Lachnospiraceae bacterium C1.1]